MLVKKLTKYISQETLWHQMRDIMLNGEVIIIV